MTLIDWVVLRRLGSRIVLTILVMFGIIALAESLDVWRVQHLMTVGGPLLALLGIATSATRWSLGVLPVTLLVGSIIGLLDLQARREMTVIKASGLSIWAVLRAPVVAVVICSLLVALVLDTGVVLVNRALSLSLPQSGSSGTLWLEQSGGGQIYVLMAAHPHPGGTVLEDVTVFMTSSETGERIHAKRVELKPGAWLIPDGIRFQPDSPPKRIADFELPTTTTRGDMGVKLASTDDLTLFEVTATASRGLGDPQLQNAVEMRLSKLLALPLMLVGSLLIAFAFTAGYRRTNKYGVAVLYGVVLGFVVYVINEMAAMAGGAGVLEPAYAAIGPAFVAIVIGVTVLLHKEDGRA
ncbi:MAG TPA: LptF/LptG family permease [Devosia sp.]